MFYRPAIESCIGVQKSLQINQVCMAFVSYIYIYIYIPLAGSVWHYSFIDKNCDFKSNRRKFVIFKSYVNRKKKV
jgi:hypothetical protein